MRAAPDQQRKLLELQKADTELGQVRHRAAVQPLAREVRELTTQMDLLRREIVNAKVSGDDLRRAVDKSEEELERVRKRLQRDREMVGQGATARAQRELEHELTSLARRLSDLEDAELAMLEQQEQVAETVTSLQSREADLTRRLAQSQESKDSAAAEIAQREHELVSHRSALAAGIPDELLKYYESIRVDTPIAAAELRGNQCGGCRLELPPSELADVRSAASDAVVCCEECGCILVRD